MEKVLYAYSIKRHNLGKYYFVADSKSLQLVMNFPDTSKNKPQGNVLMFDAWDCAKDPMLREFRINEDPDSGLVQGDKPYSFFVLVVCLWGNYLS